MRRQTGLHQLRAFGRDGECLVKGMLGADQPGIVVEHGAQAVELGLDLRAHRLDAGDGVLVQHHVPRQAGQRMRGKATHAETLLDEAMEALRQRPVGIPGGEAGQLLTLKGIGVRHCGGHGDTPQQGADGAIERRLLARKRRFEGVDAPLMGRHQIDERLTA